MTSDIQGRILDFKLPVQFDQSGAVYVINLATVLQLGRDVSLRDVNYTTVFEGDRSFARFGWSLEFTDINQDGIKDLLFSAPFRTCDITEEIKGGMCILYHRKPECCNRIVKCIYAVLFSNKIIRCIYTCVPVSLWVVLEGI